MTDSGEIVPVTEREHVFRCQHGEPIATRYPTGTWVGHDRCLRCRFAKWFPSAWRLRR